MKKLLFVLLIGLGLYAAPAYAQTKDVPAVIFETDMGNDIDDALALDILYKAMDDGLINLLAVSCHKESPTACDYVHMMNKWYGYPDVVIARGAKCITVDTHNDYTKVVNSAPKSMTKGKFEIEDAVKMYRRMLSAQPDQSVIIISVGFSTTLAALLDTMGDEYSPLTGKELVAAKVKLTSIMAGGFRKRRSPGFNVRHDIPAARKVFAEWPTPIAISPAELGSSVKYPASSILNDFGWAKYHPMVEAYKIYKEMPYDRAMWDPTSVLYALHPTTDMFTRSEEGQITVDSRGMTSFLPKAGGRDRILYVDPQQAARMKKYFVEIITRRPANHK
jgi:inosine-uridine nucleoside N-ribohydrolase